MMKIAKAVSTALLATAALSGVSAAVAATNPALGQTDLFLAVWNPTTGTSIVQDLGNPFNTLNSTSTFQNPSGYTTSWTIDNSNVATDLGAGSYQFALFAEDAVSGQAIGALYINNSSYLSQKAGTALPTTLQNGDIVDTSMGHMLTPYVQKWLPGTTTLVKGTGTSYWAGTGNPGTSFGLTALNGIGGTAITNALELVHWTTTGSSDIGTDPAAASIVGNSRGAGLFTFSGNTLTYTLAAGTVATPLPAAGWLLISGLLGLGAVGRRREAANAAA